MYVLCLYVIFNLMLLALRCDTHCDQPYICYCANHTSFSVFPTYSSNEYSLNFKLLVNLKCVKFFCVSEISFLTTLYYSYLMKHLGGCSDHFVFGLEVAFGAMPSCSDSRGASCSGVS